MQKTAKRCAIYIRASTPGQSTEVQKSDLHHYASSRGWTASGVYEDKATGTNLNRSQFQKLLGAARQRQFDLVLVWKLDRAFRSLRDMITTLQDFSDLGVEFVSLRDNLDLTTSSGRMVAHILGCFAEFEADIIRTRVRAGIEGAKRRGIVLGRPARIDVDRVVSLRAEGLSLGRIAKQVGATKSAVSKILKKRRVEKSLNKAETTQSLRRRE